MTEELLLKEFESNRDQLKSFVLRITCSMQDSEDIVQETFIKATSKLESFKGDSSLKTWVFSIASNLAKDLLRSKKRWPENVSDICREAALSNQAFFQEAMNIRHTSEQGHFEIKEHITFCMTCVSRSLALEQQLTLLLKEVYDFKLFEIAQIMELTDAKVKYHLHEARKNMIRIFDKRCSLINQEGTCHQCSELNGIFNPDQNFEEEKVKIKMVKEAEKGTKDHLFDLRMLVVKEIDPFKSKAAELQLHHLEHNREVMEGFLKKD